MLCKKYILIYCKLFMLEFIYIKIMWICIFNYIIVPIKIKNKNYIIVNIMCVWFFSFHFRVWANIWVGHKFGHQKCHHECHFWFLSPLLQNWHQGCRSLFSEQFGTKGAEFYISPYLAKKLCTVHIKLI